MKKLLFVLLLCLFSACEKYVPPPSVDLVGLTGNTLADPKAPLVISFGKPVDPATVKIRIAFSDTDVEGDLPPNDQLRIIIEHDPSDREIGARAELSPDNASLVLYPDGALPVGPKLVLVAEAGLKSTDGFERHYRTVVPFSYAVTCKQARSEKLTSGVYFLLLEVEEPLGTQIQLFGALDIDPATGRVSGQFTNADRNLDNSRCPGGCGASDACRLLPAPACVPPSTRAATADEYPDWLPNATPPVGYSFFVEGCAADDRDGAGLLTAPATMVVQQPPVTVAGLVMTAFFAADGHASGTLSADVVSLGGNPIGPGKGTMSAIRIPDAVVPANVPRPDPTQVPDAGP